MSDIVVPDRRPAGPSLPDQMKPWWRFLGIVLLAFQAGIQWHRVDVLEAAIVGLSKQEDQIKSAYELKETHSAELNGIERHLEQIDERLERIQEQTAR